MSGHGPERQKSGGRDCPKSEVNRKFLSCARNDDPTRTSALWIFSCLETQRAECHSVDMERKNVRASIVTCDIQGTPRSRRR